MERDTSSKRLDSLTGLRFFAALAVLLRHIPQFLGPFVGARWWQYGYVGVPFFFALSGFVLTWTATPGDTARAFWRRRFARVYPLYIASAIPGVVLALLGHANVTVISVPLYVFMLQAWFATPWAVNHSPNGPGWSISAEAFFYAVHPTLCPRVLRAKPRTLVKALAGLFVILAIGLAVAHVAFSPQYEVNFPYFTPIYQVVSFAAGMIVCAFVKSGVRFPSLPVAVGALVLLFLVLGLIPQDLVFRLRLNVLPVVEYISLPFMLVLIGSAAQGDLKLAPSVFRNHRIVTLGVWSYALYLVQLPILMIIRAIAPHDLSHQLLPSTLIGLGFIGLAILVAAIAHRLIEAPMNKRLRSAPPSIITQQELVPA